MLKYLKHFFTPLMLSGVTIGIMLGHSWMWMGAAIIAITMIGGDAILGDDLSEPVYKHKWLLNIPLFLALPYLVLLLWALAFMTGTGTQDFFGIGAAFQYVTGYDVFAARAQTEWYHMLGAIVGSGLTVAGYGTNIAHELTHRTTDPISMIWGRWMLAMSNNADFSIEHVYGHHETVATPKDPASAKRGNNVYWFIITSTVGGHISAWKLEANRLKKKGYWLFGFRNKMLTGYLMSLTYAGLFFLAGGWIGVGVYMAQATWAKVVFEVVNYIEHYGLARVEGQPVMPRHSWNTNKVISSIVLFSLTRHSAHHEKGDLPFWYLKPYPEAPEMPFGYLTTIVVALIPPLWHKVMEKPLKDWDERHATPDELEIIRTAHLGLPAQSESKEVGAA